MLSDYGGRRTTVFEGVLDPAIPEVHVLANVELQDPRRLRTLLKPLLRSPPPHVPGRQIDDARTVAERFHLAKQAAATDLSIVGMGAESKEINRHRSILRADEKSGKRRMAWSRNRNECG